MTTDTIALPQIGQRVRITNASPASLIGKVGNIVGQYSASTPFVAVEGHEPYSFGRPDGAEGSWGVREWVVLTPAVGDRVIALEVPGMEEYNGKEGTVTQVTSDSCIYAEFQSIQKPDDTEQFYFYAWKPVEGSIIDTPTIPVADHDREIARLTERIESLERQLRTGRETHADLGNRLLNEAQRRGWCSEFDEFVEDYNSDCPGGWEIETRVKRTCKRMRIKAEIYRDVYVWVDDDADDDTDPDNWYESESDAEDEALGEDWVNDQLVSEYENNGFDSIEQTEL